MCVPFEYIIILYKQSCQIQILIFDTTHPNLFGCPFLSQHQALTWLHGASCTAEHFHINVGMWLQCLCVTKVQTPSKDCVTNNLSPKSVGPYQCSPHQFTLAYHPIRAVLRQHNECHMPRQDVVHQQYYHWTAGTCGLKTCAAILDAYERDKCVWREELLLEQNVGHSSYSH